MFQSNGGFLSNIRSTEPILGEIRPKTSILPNKHIPPRSETQSNLSTLSHNNKHTLPLEMVAVPQELFQDDSLLITQSNYIQILIQYVLSKDSDEIVIYRQSSKLCRQCSYRVDDMFNTHFHYCFSSSGFQITSQYSLGQKSETRTSSNERDPSRRHFLPILSFIYRAIFDPPSMFILTKMKRL